MNEDLIKLLATDYHSALHITKMLAAKILSCKEMRFPFGGETVEIVDVRNNEYGDEKFIVLKVDDKFFKFVYTTGSFDMEWEFYDLTEVFPKQIIKYEF